MNRFKQLKTWLQDCPAIDNYLYFNVLPDDVESKAVNTEYASYNVLAEYIDGSREVELFFNISICKDYDKGTSDVNVDAIDVFEDINNWMREQNIEGNLPDFGDDTISVIEPYSSNPDVYINEDDTKCVYEARYRIEYMER